MDNRFVVSWPWLTSIRPYLALGDVVAFLLAALILGQPGSVAVGIAAIGLGICASVDLHRDRLSLHVGRDAWRLGFAVLVATLALVVLGPLRLAVADDWTRIVLFAAAAGALMTAWRGATYVVVRAARRSRRTARPTIVVGAGTVGRHVVDALEEHRELGLVPIGIVEDGTGASARPLPLPVLGDLGCLEWAMVDLGARDIVFAFPEPPQRAEIEEVDLAVARGHRVWVVPHFFEVAERDRARGVEQVGDVELLRVADWGLRPQELLGRRLVDVVAASASLVLLAPILAVIAAAVRAECGRASILLRRHRTDRAGRPYVRSRFRTVGAPRFAPGTTVWRIDNDSRIGPVGRLLRRTRLDKLPRLLDVVVGDISLFPVRAARPDFVGEFPRVFVAPHAAPAFTGRAAPRPVGDTRETARALK